MSRDTFSRPSVGILGGEPACRLCSHEQPPDEPEADDNGDDGPSHLHLLLEATAAGYASQPVCGRSQTVAKLSESFSLCRGQLMDSPGLCHARLTLASIRLKSEAWL